MMKRTLVGLSDQDFQALDTLSDVKRVSRAELIRQAVSQYLEKFKSEPATDGAFGLWAQKNEDGLAYQQRLREEW
jgi:metal-responsive CopG/Arc/MetJ family transcriptional regulator